MAHKVMFTYNIYKDEFNATAIAYFINRYGKESESAKMVTLANCTEEDCMKIASCMYKTLEECKEVFADMLTIAEEVNKAFDEMRNTFLVTMCKFVDTPAFKAGEVMDEKTAARYQALWNMYYAQRDIH